jgi:hypothetical protein
MHSEIYAAVAKKWVDPLNPILANGIVIEHMKYLNAYIDRIAKCVAQDFPPGLIYEGMFQATPEEAFNTLSKKKNSRRVVEVAPTDIYMVKMRFSWLNNPIVIPLFLPFVTDGGLMRLRGSLFTVSAIVTDKAVSVGQNTLFVPFTRDKFTFERLVHHVSTLVEDPNMPGTYVEARESLYAAWAKIYKRSPDSLRKQGKVLFVATTTLPHYLFCKYGLLGTFENFAGIKPEVGYADYINPINFNPKEWKIISSAGIKPPRYGYRPFEMSEFRIAIRHSEWTPLVQGLVAGLFYVIDYFPDQIKPEYINSVDETRMWMILLGEIIFPTGVNKGKLEDDMRPHFASLDAYMDAEARQTLLSDNIDVKNIYEFLAMIVGSFNQRIMEGMTSISSMYDKRLTVLKYITSPINNNLFLFSFDLQKGKTALTTDNIRSKLSSYLKPDVIMSINYRHGEVHSLMSSSDNKIFNITSQIVQQTSSSGKNNKSKTSLTNPAFFLDSSLAELASPANPSKAEPSGRSRMNVNAIVDANGNFVRREIDRELLDRIQSEVKR